MEIHNLDQNKSGNGKKGKGMEISNLTEETWLKRLDMAFDQSNKDGVELKENEIAEYVDFNKKYLEKIEYFIENIKKLDYLFLCQPEPISFEESDFYQEKPYKAEIILTKIIKIEFCKVTIVNYGYGDPNKILDYYELELFAKGKYFNYELSSRELVRFCYQGSLMEKNGDILAINVQKAVDTLNRYYS